MFELLKSIVAFAVLVVAARYLLRIQASHALKLLFALFFVRFVLAAFHSITYVNIVGPLSIMSLASIASVGLCCLLLPVVKPSWWPKLVISKSLFAIYCLIALMVLSAVLNSTLSATLPSLIKWLYLLQLVALIAYALTLDGLKNTLKVLLLAYAFPLVMLLLSIVLGVAKRAELDGSTSFIGGFFHEAVFSTIVFTAAFFTLTYLNTFIALKPVRKTLYFSLALVTFFVLMIFINYRTSIIAFILMSGALIVFTVQAAKPLTKALFVICVCLSALWVATFDLGVDSERFADLPNAYNNASELITYPENYSRDDRRLFSGRIYMWSAYISEANEGSALQLFIGRGMGSWKEYFLKYAHNTFVSFYFELGLLGLSLCLLIFVALYRMLNRITDRNIRACSIAFLVGFLVLNMSTMPMWSMEGLYCLAFLIALGRQPTLESRQGSLAMEV